MSTPVVSIDADAPVEQVARLLHEHDIGAVPVLDEGRLVGMVSDGDLLRHPEGRVRQAMTRHVVTVESETPLAEVARLLTRRHIKRVPVMEGGRLTGIVSRTDLVHALAEGRMTQGVRIVPGIRRAAERGHSSEGLADVYYSFSYGDFYDTGRSDLGVLRALNEKCVRPGAGPTTYGLRDVEVVTYVIEGAIMHEDSLDNETILRPGDVQCISAGLGVRLFERYDAEAASTRFLKIWIEPHERGLKASYSRRHFAEADRRGRLCTIVSPQGGDAVRVHQDARIYAGLFDGAESARFEAAPGRLAYLHVARGAIDVNDMTLRAGDAFIGGDEPLALESGHGAEVLILDLPERRSRGRGA